MSNWFGEEVNKEVMEASEKSEFAPLDSGIYTARIKKAYLVDSSQSEAKALWVSFELESGKLWDTSLWFKSGKGLTTYVDGKGNTKYLPSFIMMQHLFNAVEVDMGQVSPKIMTVKHFNDEISTGVFEELLGKTLEIGIRQVLVDDYNDEYQSKEETELSYVGSTDGFSGKEKRDKATEQKDKASWLKMIEKKPVKDSRKKSKGDKPASSGSEENKDAVAGW